MRWVHRAEDAALVACVVALVFLSFAQIALRTLLGVALPWSEPLVRHLVLWSSFLGALIAARQDRHIRIDALLRVSPAPARRLMEGAAALGSAAVCLALTVISIRYLRDERSFGAHSLLGIPAWQLQVIFPLTFGGMGLRFLHRFASSLQPADLRGQT